MMNHLPDIEDRRRAVTTFGKNIVVTAGAGTGKTTLLVDRVIHLLMREPFPLEITDLVALTFTNKAANEMKIRLKARLQALLFPSSDPPPDPNDPSPHEDRMLSEIIARYGLSRDRIKERAAESIKNLEKSQICTMHSFAGHILRLFPVEAGIDPRFKEDDGTEFEEHFEREWEDWIEAELSSGSPRRDLWQVVLRQTGLEPLKSFGRELCRELIPIPRLEQAGNQHEPDNELRRWLEGQCRKVQALLSKYTKSRKIEQQLQMACDAIHAILTGQDAAIHVEDVSSGAAPAGWDPDDYREALRTIRMVKRLLSVDKQFFNVLLELLPPFAAKCRERFTASGNISFDGLLTLCRDLLKTRPKVRRELKRRFKAILVDEFQDTDPVQYEILLYLSEIPDRHEEDWRKIRLAPGKIFIVGDPKQSIYAFRRADIEAYSHVVERILAGDKGLKADLTTSFRSHHRILTVVNELFSRIIRKRELLQPEYVPLIPHPDNRAALPVQRVELRLVDGRGREDIDAASATRLEAEAIGKWLREEMLGREAIVESGENKEVVSPRHIAILLRKLTDVSKYLEVFRRYNIPYIVEGERHFYATQEVIDFVNLLKAIDNPCDTLSLVGVLRSPLGGLSDSEIEEMNRLSLLDYRIPDETLKKGITGVSLLKHLDRFLCDLYGPLRRLHSEAGAKSPPEAICSIFATLPVLELAASSFHGEQALANLQKIQKISESVSHKSDLTFKGFTTLLEKRVETLKEEGESLLTEETVDAVRILSIHKAKGLEFPVVILAGMHSASKGGEDSVSVLYDWSTNEMGLKVDNLRNYGAVMLNERRMSRDEEEQKRLLYVAMTRARECLILSGALYRRGNRESFLSMIRDVTGDPLGDETFNEIVIGEGRIRQTLIDPAGCVPQYSPETDKKQEAKSKRLEVGKESLETLKSDEIEILVDLWMSRNKRYDAVREKKIFMTPSRLEEEIERLPLEKEEIPEKEKTGRERSTLIGTLAHDILEHWDYRKDPSLFKEAVEEACLKFTPVQFAAEIASIRDDLDRIFKTFSASPVYGELRRGTIIGREVPFTIPWDGRIMDGVIDLIYRFDGSLYVADYKTDKISEEDIAGRIKEYFLSGRIYTEAVRKCLKVDVSGFKLIFLRLGKSVDANLS